MAKPRRIYWDACAWIAYIARERVRLKGGTEENRYEMCKKTLKNAEDGKIEIVTSAFTLAEVCKRPDITQSPAHNLPSFFDQSYILIIPVDKFVGITAQNLQTAGTFGLKPPDAIHVASAYIAKVEELNSFDGDITNLDGKIVGRNGQPIKMCKPGEAKPAGPLFQVVAKDDDEQGSA